MGAFKAKIKLHLSRIDGALHAKTTFRSRRQCNPNERRELFKAVLLLQCVHSACSRVSNTACS